MLTTVSCGICRIDTCVDYCWTISIRSVFDPFQNNRTTCQFIHHLHHMTSSPVLIVLVCISTMRLEDDKLSCKDDHIIIKYMSSTHKRTINKKGERIIPLKIPQILPKYYYLQESFCISKAFHWRESFLLWSSRENIWSCRIRKGCPKQNASIKQKEILFTGVCKPTRE